MKEPRAFSSMLAALVVIILSFVSQLSASVTFWDVFESAANGNYNLLGPHKVNSSFPILDMNAFNFYNILLSNDSLQLHWKPDEIHENVIFNDMLIRKTFSFVPDEFLTRKIISKVRNHGQPYEWHIDMPPISEPSDDSIFKNDADCIKAMRTPAPGSLILVAVGLLSLRFTRRLRY